ncbi:hypothetical protein M0R45_028861 [Rubus argutus]|uniref:Uncharacterized protein n=1 Tax=Rubus argutus TaxID=59490 RepID=A0AAW1W6S3_RUBAR
MMIATSSSASSSSATVAVDKATSDLLISPDWTMNIDICDSVNSHQWQAKDVVKAVKRRLQHRNPKVQFLALTLLETMVKNCGDYIHFQIAERNLLGEMIKIVKKKTDMQVRDKILILVDSWQAAFGGPSGKHPQYYWAYDELRRSGIDFPKHSLDAAPMFAPPVTNTTPRPSQAGYGMPSNSSRRLDETMATDIENLSLSSLDSMKDVMELLSDMLQAVNPNDRLAVKDEVIVELVNRCRANQKKLIHMLTTTGDEELLARGLELNDSLQSLLARNDAIASGLPLPTTNFSPQQAEMPASSSKHTEVKESSTSNSSPRPKASPSAPAVTMRRVQFDEDEEEEDEFAQLARRHSRQSSSRPTESTPGGTNEGLSLQSPATPPPPPAASIPPPPPASNGGVHQIPASPTVQGNSYPSQAYPGNPGLGSYNSYVVPWAQPQAQLQQPQFRPQPQPQPQFQSQFQPQYPQYSSAYPAPPWAASPGFPNNQNHLSTNSTFFTPRANTTASYMPAQGATPLQQYNSFPARGATGSDNHGGFPTIPGPRSPAPAAGQKPFIPSYRLFEDLNVFGNADGKLKVAKSNTSSGFSGTPGQGMVGGRK